MRNTHSNRLERWLGTELVEQISRNTAGWYGPPLAIAGVPGKVYAAGDGDFVGPLDGGYFGSLMDYTRDKYRSAYRRWAKRQASTVNMGFTSLSDLISEATTGGKRQDFFFTKTGTGAVAGRHYSLWNLASLPAAGGAPAARPGGAVPTNATTGSFQQVDGAGSDTLHITTVQALGTTGPTSLMLYDRTFHAGSINHATLTAQSITGVPTRYATTTSPGVFAFLEVVTALNAVAHTAVLQYTDQDGNAAENTASLTIIISSVITQIPHFPWFLPLNAGDTGLRTMTNLTFSSAGSPSGTSNLVMGKPYCICPCPIAQSMVVLDGINSAFNLPEVLDGACVNIIDMHGVGSATTHSGTVVMVSG